MSNWSRVCNFQFLFAKNWIWNVCHRWKSKASAEVMWREVQCKQEACKTQNVVSKAGTGRESSKISTKRLPSQFWMSNYWWNMRGQLYNVQVFGEQNWKVTAFVSRIFPFSVSRLEIDLQDRTRAQTAFFNASSGTVTCMKFALCIIYSTLSPSPIFARLPFRAHGQYSNSLVPLDVQLVEK